MTKIPDGAIIKDETITEGTEIGARCELHNCVIKSGVLIGNNCKLVGCSLIYVKVGNDAIMEDCEFMSYAEFGNGCKLVKCTLHHDSRLGEDVTLGACNFVSGAMTFGKRTRLLDCNSTADSMDFGRDSGALNCVLDSNVRTGKWFYAEKSKFRTQLIAASYANIVECSIDGTIELDSCATFSGNKIKGIPVLEHVCLSNVKGSSGRTVLIFKSDTGLYVSAGCFFGTPQEFSDKAAAEDKSKYGKYVLAMAEILWSE